MKILSIFFLVALFNIFQACSMNESAKEIVNSNDVIHFLTNGDRDVEENKLSVEEKYNLMNKFVETKKFIPALKLLWSEKDQDNKIKWLTEKAKEGYPIFMIELAYTIAKKPNLDDQIMSLNWFHFGSLMILINIKCHYNSIELVKAHEQLDNHAVYAMVDNLDAIPVEDMNKIVLKSRAWACIQAKKLKIFQDPSWIGYSKPAQKVRLDLMSEKKYIDIKKEIINIWEQYLNDKGINIKKTNKAKKTLLEIVDNLKHYSIRFKKTGDKEIDIKNKTISNDFKALNNVD